MGSEGYSNYGRGKIKRGKGRGGRNPVDKQGKVSVCVLCNSEWHWARECPQKVMNKNKEESRPMAESRPVATGSQDKESDEERVYVGEVSKVDEKPWGEIYAILDTGCKSTVCGEL